MKVPLLDVAGSNASIRERAFQRLRELVDAGTFVLGGAVSEFEASAAEYVGVRAAVGVSSGSDALVTALLALGIGAGDEVVTTPFSFFATVESILRVGAQPRFVDIRRDTYELDWALVESAITRRTRAILVVHLYGQPARMAELRQVADAHGLPLIEDGAQAFGARSGSGRVGSLGAVGCFSFQPTKPLGAWGDAGLVVTNDVELAERCRRLRAHGATAKHLHQEIGGNYRLDAVQAIVLSEKLPRLDGALAARRAHAAAYDRDLSTLPGIVTPAVVSGTEPSVALYTIRVLRGQRDRLREFLSARGVETAVHYPVPLHQQPALARTDVPAPSLAEAERAAREVLCLPLYPELREDQRAFVVECVREFFGHANLPTFPTYQS